jgi:hypothetical protein
VDIKAGTWFDHENNEGGGVIDFVMKYKGVDDRSGALDFLVSPRCIDPAKPNGRVKEEAEVAKAASMPYNAAVTQPKFKVTKVWIYVDETGAELFEVCRLEDGICGEDGKPNKTYRQRHKTPDGYEYSVKGLRQVPYQLPRLIEAIKQDVTVFITEGEKCADAVIISPRRARSARLWRSKRFRYRSPILVAALVRSWTCSRTPGISCTAGTSLIMAGPAR